MMWVAMYLWVGGVPIALHHADNLVGDTKKVRWLVNLVSAFWPFFWPPVYAYAIVWALVDRWRK